MSVGKRIYLKRVLPEKEIMDGFRTIPASNVGDVMGRLCGMNPRIRLMSAPKSQMTVGPALTVKTAAGDNLTLHAALSMAQEGDFLVVSNEGGSARAIIGEVMMSFLKYDRKVAGIIVDGPIRDIDALASWDFPIYATGTNPGGPYKDGPGEINVPIACGDISVNPGDIILADPDGVIVIPRQDAAQILEAARVFQAADEKKAAAAKNGCADRSWVEKALADKGYEIIDDYYRL